MSMNEIEYSLETFMFRFSALRTPLELNALFVFRLHTRMHFNCMVCSPLAITYLGSASSKRNSNYTGVLKEEHK